VKNCTREKIRGRCKFYVTCYGIHPEDLSIIKYLFIDPSNNTINTGFNNLEEILKNYVSLEEHNNLIKKYEAAFGCKKCKKVFFETNMGMTKCLHLFCEECLYSIFKQNELVCPVCKVQIEKKSLMRMKFK
jgi:hypothetical protein